MTVRGRRGSRPRLRALARWTMLVVVAVAVAFGGWGVVSALRAEGELQSASRELTAYQQARAAVRDHRAALARYASQPSDGDAAVLQGTGTAMAEALAAAELEAEGRDETFSAVVLRTHTRYAAAAAAVLANVRAGRPGSAREIHGGRARPEAQLLDDKLGAGVVRSRARSLQLAARERRSERVALATAPAALLLTLAIGVLGGLPRRRRRAERVELRRLTQAALTDTLTGLRNRRAFDQDASGMIRRRNKSGGGFSVMMLDLDGLKQINDSFGHAAGDERIREVAGLLRSAVRDGDTAYRTGGDEFMVLLPGERAWGAFHVAQRLHELAASSRAGVSVTIGIAESVGLEGKETVVRRADVALYEAKRARRKIVVYSPELEARPPQREERDGRQHSALVATALARAVASKDEMTRAHCETVSELCGLIGHELGLDAERVTRLRLAGLLHDVGKIGIPEEVLNKETPLDDRESEVIRGHVLVGERIVAAAGLDAEARWIREHHERLDGSGYPNGLPGDAISLEARIIAVADAFEAITADRPYRKARSTEEGLAELVRNAGTHFDPACVEAVRRVVLGAAAERPLFGAAA